MATQQNQRGGVAALKNDPDAWAGGVLSLGSAGAKLLTGIEHVDFLMSVGDGHFKMIFQFWDTIGWWLVFGFGATVIIHRILKPIHQRKPITLGFVGAIALIAFVFGSIWTTLASREIPRVVASMVIGSCASQLDTSRLMSFADKYNIALVCFLQDPTTDPLQDKKITVSNFFTIVPGGIQIVADVSKIMPRLTSAAPGDNMPNAAQPPQNHPAAPTGTSVTVNFIAVLVPKDVSKGQFSTLGELERLGGKLLDQKYYQN